MAPDSIAGTDQWADQILAAIQDCPCMVVLISEDATASRHVAREVSLALDSNKGVIPVRITPAELTGTLNYLLHLVQRVDVFPQLYARHSSALLVHLSRAFNESASAGAVRMQQDRQRSDTQPHPRTKVYANPGAAVLFLAGIGAAVLHSRPESNPQNVSLSVSTTTARSSPPPATATSATTTATITSPAATTAHPDPQTAAIAALQAIRAADLPKITLTGQWVAQLASKTPGIVDLNQTTVRGDHTFTALDILNEYQKARSNPVYGGFVDLLLSTDYRTQQLHDGQPLWVTFCRRARVLVCGQCQNVVHSAVPDADRPHTR